MEPRMTALPRLALALMLMSPLLARAESYRVDLIVFLDKGGVAGELGRRPLRPDTSGALEVTDSSGQKAAGITLLADEQFGLPGQWQKLQNSRRYQPLIRLAWIQKDPPAEHGPALHLQWGNELANGDTGGLLPVDGTVRLLAGHYLHLDADLAYTQALAEGSRISYRLHENRRMRRDELHHLDSPRLGILARVTKAGGP